jgi:hypothetical protein
LEVTRIVRRVLCGVAGVHQTDDATGIEVRFIPKGSMRHALSSCLGNLTATEHVKQKKATAEDEDRADNRPEHEAACPLRMGARAVVPVSFFDELGYIAFSSVDDRASVLLTSTSTGYRRQLKQSAALGMGKS